VHNRQNHGYTVSLFVAICGICLSASFTQYTVTITQAQESVSNINPESESGDF